MRLRSSRGFRLREELASSLLFVPGLIVLLAIALAVTTVHLDARGLTARLDRVIPVGTAATTSDLLATIATGAITLTALVFSITMLVLQLASNQFSPRVLRTFLRDRTAKITLGVLVGTFVYSLLAMRAADESAGDKPSLTAGVAMLLALGSVAVFVKYIDHISHKIRASSVMTSITDEARQVIVARYATTEPPLASAFTASTSVRQVITAEDRGFVVSVDTAGLVGAAARCDGVIVVVPRIGDFVATGNPLLEVHGPSSPAEAVVRSMVVLGAERTTQQDVSFAFRQLVDIVEKSMSPAINDTTTAVHAVNNLRELLRMLATRPFPSEEHRDDRGAVRVVLRTTTWDEYVALAADDVLEVGGGSRRVRAAVECLLSDVHEVAQEPARRWALQRRMWRLEAVRLRRSSEGPVSDSFSAPSEASELDLVRPASFPSQSR